MYGAFSSIYRHEGIAGFYRGLIPSLLGVTHVVVQFPLYEYFKDIASACRVRATLTAGDIKKSDRLSPTDILLCSGGSKMLASITTYPHEVLRTRLQMQQSARGGADHLGFLKTVYAIAKNEGIRGFYRGLGVNLVRTVPSSGLTILTCVAASQCH